MSFHLKTLKDAGLIRDRKQGRWVYYALEPSMIETLDEWIGTLATAAKVGRPGRPCAG
jgi:ArsR family transcriptional regulator